MEDPGVLSEGSGLLLLQTQVFCSLSLISLLWNDFKYPDLMYYKRMRIPGVNAHGVRSTQRRFPNKTWSLNSEPGRNEERVMLPPGGTRDHVQRRGSRGLSDPIRLEGFGRCLTPTPGPLLNAYPTPQGQRLLRGDSRRGTSQFP